MAASLKEIRREVKKKQKQIRAEEQKKTEERVKKVDNRVDTVGGKLYRFNVRVFGIGFVNWWMSGNVGRGLLWLMQDFITAAFAIGTTFWAMTTFLPNIGNAIGHSAGLVSNAPYVDFQNLMFNPMMYCDMALLAAQIYLVRLVWNLTGKLFGHWRKMNAEKHGIKDYK